MRFDFTQGNLVEAFVRQRKSKSGWLDEIDELVAWPDLASLFDHNVMPASHRANR